MKKVILLFPLVLLTFLSFGQAVTDSASLRNRVNTDIVTNNSKAITAAKLNRILQGYLNIWPKYSVDSFRISNDSVYYRKNKTWLFGFLTSGGSGDIEPGWGMTKSGDSLYAGGAVGGVVGYYLHNTKRGGYPLTYFRVSNRMSDSSVVTGSTLNLPAGVTDNTYGAPYFDLRRIYKEEYGDTLNQQYGGMISAFNRTVLDSTGSIFGSGSKAYIPGDNGFSATNQFFPTKDSMVVISHYDGQDGGSFNSHFGIGGSWGYNINVQNSIIPGYPLGDHVSQIDLMRENSRTRMRKIYGNGIAGFVSSFKDWQASINPATTPAGHYISKIAGYMAIGQADWQMGSGGATKAQILANTTIDTSIAFEASRQWRSNNSVKNGFGFVSHGDSDRNYMAGKLRIGGGLLPTDANGGLGDKKFELHGDGRINDYLYFKGAGYISGFNTVNINTPGAVYFQPVDSTQLMYFGMYGNSATFSVRPKYGNLANKGGIDAEIITQYNTDAAFRLGYYVDGSVNPAFRYFLNGNKFTANVIDSISFNAPVYKFKNMPRATTAYKVFYDSTNQTLSYYPDSGSGTGDVVGPASSTDYAIPSFNGTTGKLLRNGLLLTNSSGDLIIPDAQNLRIGTARVMTWTAGSNNLTIGQDVYNTLHQNTGHTFFGTANESLFDATGHLGVRTSVIAGANLALPPGTSSKGAINILNGAKKTTPADGDIEKVGSFRFTQTNGIRYANGGLLSTLLDLTGNVGTGEDDLHTYTILGGTLVEDGDIVRFDMDIAWTSGTIRLYYGATEIASVVHASGTGVRLEGRILRTGAATQVITVYVTANGAHTRIQTATSETLSGNVILKSTGEATSTNQIVAQLSTIHLEPINK